MEELPKLRLGELRLWKEVNGKNRRSGRRMSDAIFLSKKASGPLKIGDKKELDRFISAQKLEFAEDKDGDPVYLAQSAWWLARAQRDNPKIEFLATKERH